MNVLRDEVKRRILSSLWQGHGAILKSTPGKLYGDALANRMTGRKLPNSQCANRLEGERDGYRRCYGPCRVGAEVSPAEQEYLGEGDLHRASEKGWEYAVHDDFGVVVRNARQRYRQPSLSRMSYAAQELHRNYYKRDLLLDSDEIEEQLGEVERMIDVYSPSLNESRRYAIL